MSSHNSPERAWCSSNVFNVRGTGAFYIDGAAVLYPLSEAYSPLQMSKYTQNEVSRVVWPWVEGPRGSKAATGLSRPVRAVIQTLVMLCIAFLLHWWKPEHFMWKVVLGLTGVVFVSGLFVPPVFNAIERFGQALGRWVSVGLTWGLLVPFFYLCFVPGRCILRLKGKDPLHRAFPTDAKTYWIPRPPIDDLKQYKKQH